MDLYKIIGQYKLNLTLRFPLLIIDGISIKEIKEKAELLRYQILQRFGKNNDLLEDSINIKHIPILL